MLHGSEDFKVLCSLAHLEGDFPGGGVVDLPFRFTLRGDKISKLIIAL